VETGGSCTSSKGQSSYLKCEGKKTYGDNMFSIPLWISKVDKGGNRHEEIKGKLENFEIWSTHGAVNTEEGT
jgi:hypothetical protein